ncbi:MAG: hypothetical protein CL946_10540, partial [Ectothiorhodospiraceae bacterium]|nr:hypothetical protein [Ectothiorhodospiraceae bacterium]
MKRTSSIYLPLLALAAMFTFSPQWLHGQSDSRADTTSAQNVIAADDSLTITDTLTAMDDSLRVADTTLAWEVVNSTDTIVTYQAQDSVVYDLKGKKMHMYTVADVDYGSYGIKADRLIIDWEDGTMFGKGIPDTTAGREDELMGTPIFSEGGEEYTGREMSYNFKTKRGVISYGETAIDDGFYLGERIKRMSNEVYFIQDGKYTTCDNPDHKHFHFGSPKMKVVPDDVVVAENVVFYVEEIPLLWIPFAVVPNSGGRSSGIIIPAFGDDPRRGRFLKDGGYYLAASDYWDLALTGDWYSKGGYLLKSDVRYNLRYNLSGSVSAAYGRQQYDIGNPTRPDDDPRTDFKIRVTHNQTIDPTSSITADFSYESTGFTNNFSTNLQELVNQQSNSNATYSKRWEGTNRSMSVSVQRSQNLTTGTSTTTLPSLSFNQSQIYPFRAEGSLGNEWYEQIGLNYRLNAKHQIDVLER